MESEGPVRIDRESDAKGKRKLLASEDGGDACQRLGYVSGEGDISVRCVGHREYARAAGCQLGFQAADVELGGSGDSEAEDGDVWPDRCYRTMAEVGC
jgi:hypothetical protein